MSSDGAAREAWLDWARALLVDRIPAAEAEWRDDLDAHPWIDRLTLAELEHRERLEAGAAISRAFFSVLAWAVLRTVADVTSPVTSDDVPEPPPPDARQRVDALVAAAAAPPR